MSDSKRVWVIDQPKPPAHGGEPGKSGRYEAMPLRDRTWSLFWLCYSVGPFAAVVMRQGRARFLWATVGMAALAVWGGTVWRWDDLSRWIATGRIPFAPWLAGMLVMSALGVGAWSRSVYLAGTDVRFLHTRLPNWMRNPVSASVLGIIAPGAGLLATGAPGRAALTFWNACMATLAVPVFWQAAWLWRANRASANGSIPSTMLETVFLAAFAVGFLGALVWTVSVFDSIRQASISTRVGASIRADRLMFVLLASLIVACLVSQPTTMARDANGLATYLERGGMRRIPLCLAQLARTLDPARPAYALHAAALFEANGDVPSASRVRSQVRANWQEAAIFFARVAPDDSVHTPMSADTLRATTPIPAPKAEDTRPPTTPGSPAPPGPPAAQTGTGSVTAHSN